MILTLERFPEAFLSQAQCEKEGYSPDRDLIEPKANQSTVEVSRDDKGIAAETE